MTKDQFLGILRHVITAVGVGVAVAGPANEALFNEAGGAVLAVASVIWSIWEKTRRA
jgi:hypothetical protein